jgi:hypothetical protein
VPKNDTGNLKKPGRKMDANDRRETEEHLGHRGIRPRSKSLPPDLLEVGPDETSTELKPYHNDERDQAEPPRIVRRPTPKRRRHVASRH